MYDNVDASTYMYIIGLNSTTLLQSIVIIAQTAESFHILCRYIGHSQPTISLDGVQVRLYDVIIPLGGCGSIQEANSWFGLLETLCRVNSSGMVGAVRNERA